MRLVFATQLVDADDPHLAQTLDMVRALAARCESVHVLCDRVGRHDLPANVSFAAFGARAKAARGLRFEAALVRAGPTDGFLAHMVPRFLLLAAPFLRLRGIPLLLWYTHWNASREVRLATRVCDAVISVQRDSYPLPSPKVRAIGHAIDLTRFPPRDRAPDGVPFRLLALGRTEPRKRLDLLLDAVERAVAVGFDLNAEIRGPQITAAERRHRDELERRIAGSAVLRKRVAVADAVSRDELADLIRTADALVSLTRGETAGGALDKVVYEAAASAVPAIACNPNFGDLLGGHAQRLLFRAGDVDDFLAVVRGLAALAPDDRTALGHALRARMAERHSAESWADAVVSIVAELAGSQRARTSSS